MIQLRSLWQHLGLTFFVAVSLAALIGAGGSFLALVGTQGMTGRETTADLAIYFSLWFLYFHGIGAALGLPLALFGLPLNRAIKVYTASAMGLLAGALLGALAIAATLDRSLAFLAILGSLPIPLVAALAGATAALKSFVNISDGEASDDR